MAEDQEKTQAERMELERGDKLTPSFAVNTNLTERLEAMLEDITTAELLTVVLARVEVFREAQQGTPAGREFALAITHAEDARTRWNAGIYRMNGTYAPSDAQKQLLANDPTDEEVPSV